MNLGKESKMLEQGIITWLIFAAAVLIVWAAIFASAVYVFNFMKGSPERLWAAVAATILTTAIVITAKKFLRK